jgi:diguanylate cyclase (GGDEF)-like protein/PAS domain S-box-containing protein
MHRPQRKASSTWSDELGELAGVDVHGVGLELEVRAHPDDVAILRETFETARRERAPKQVEHRVVAIDGTIRHVLTRLEYQFDLFGTPDGAGAATLDITERKEHEERLVFVAHHDALTGLPNRTLLNDRLHQALAYAKRKERMIAIAFLDLDRFKTINDSLGHSAGDELLVSVAQRLRECVRPYDTISRQGGDEFVIVLDDLASPDDVSELATRLLGAFATPFTLAGGAHVMKPSIGIALFPADGEDAEELLRNADAAMYVAKRSGGGAFQYFSPRFHAAALKQLAMEQALRRAIEAQRVGLRFQPLYTPDGKQITGLEALARWSDEAFGPLEATEIVALAEEAGFATEFGELILRSAAAQGAAWLAEGLEFGRLTVNVSPRQVALAEFSARTLEILAQTGFPPERLLIDLPEAALLAASEAAEEAVRSLRRAGVAFALDDTGTGYSALAHLKRLPIERLKIDRTFVAGVAADASDRSIARAVIAVAHDLGKNVTVEGVETLRQLELLTALGADDVQGYYFSRPLPAEALPELLRRAGGAT